MSTATALVSTGLVLDIAGVCLIWKYGIPENVNRGGVSHYVLEQIDEAEANRAQRYDRYSRVGLGLLVLGFLLQLLGSLIAE